MSDCHLVRPGDARYAGKQGFSYEGGIARESVGSTGLCMHVLRVPPGGRAKAHKHVAHETAIYVLAGRGTMFWGDRLQHRMEAGPGEMVYIPADMPHLPVNEGVEELVAVLARTDPHEQESVALLPELDALVPSAPPAHPSSPQSLGSANSTELPAGSRT